jgi:UDP-glucose:(heptosyl)LPS alpha-1,3-glucosyltransferase
MRVAIIKSNYTPYGGAEKYTRGVIRAFLQRDARVDVLTAAPGGWGSPTRGLEIISMKQAKYNNLLRLLSFNRSVGAFLKGRHYDCILGMDRTEIQTHLRAGGGSHAAWLRRRSAECSSLRRLSFRLNPFHRATVNMEGKAFLSPGLKRIFCNSHMVQEEISQLYPAAAGKIMVVHNGVEWGAFSDPFQEAISDRERILEALSLDPHKFYFLFVGSGYERKGLRKALSAMPYLPDHVDLLVVGKDRNEKRYVGTAEKLGLGDKIHFLGAQGNVVPFLQVADAFVLPTLYDPFSNACLEALAMGLYVVTTRANGCSEVVKPGAGSLIQDPTRPRSVADAMHTAFTDRMSKEEIRGTVRHLELDTQLYKMVDTCLEDAV